MKKIIINHFFCYEFVYIFLFCFVVFLLISIFIKQKFIKKVSILFFSIFFMSFIFEIVLSFFMTMPISNYNNSIIDVNDVLPIKTFSAIRALSPNNEAYNLNEDVNINKLDSSVLIYNKKYSKYNNNLRVTKCNNISEEVFVFLGCSFTFGDGLNDNETLPYYFSKIFNFEKNIINCGVSGKSFNTALNILNYEYYLPLINNENSKIKHFFYLFINDHIYRNFRYEGECLDGFLICKNNKLYIPTTIGKIKYIFARSYIFRKVFIPMIDEYFYKYYENYMLENLKEMNRIVEEKYKSKLTIVVWEKDSYVEYFIKKLKEMNLDLVFLPDKFNSGEEYRIKNDGHPTAKANKEIAEILYNHINEKDEMN